MKKILAFLLVLSFVFSISTCSSTQEQVEKETKEHMDWIDSVIAADTTNNL